ncbi:hypothetical protein [Fulvivirga sediminis]|uniref:Uncharacterized protein n=1 Tax=Fulvivirga sediminis TaxID=2803949 RepID=A0A937FCA1_9BACT|nr:hypothetical protein [Fulvivirga sediminis]MBL3658260.1 hypothetical protein [Fulvivirga sediminis]
MRLLGEDAVRQAGHDHVRDLSLGIKGIYWAVFIEPSTSVEDMGVDVS